MRCTPRFVLLLVPVAVVLLGGEELPGEQAPELRIETAPGEVVVSDQGQPLATYVYNDPEVYRPYFKDLFAPGGLRVTRNYPPQAGDPDDHATYHPGLFWGFGDISGSDFWRNRAHVKHAGFAADPSIVDGQANFSVRNNYVSQDGQVVCQEDCQFRVVGRPGGYFIVWDSRFHSPTGDFYFGDQEELGLGLRLHTPLIVEDNTGRILNSDGLRDEEGTWGKVAKWCDYAGKLDGRFVGAAIMTAPTNFRPSWFHSRDYGLVVANPFGQNAFTEGEKSKVVVKQGDSLRLQYGVFVHVSHSEDDLDLAGAYRDYLGLIE